MKNILLLVMTLISFNVYGQFTKTFAPNMLFKTATEFGYEDLFSYWQVYNESQPDSTTIYELRGFTSAGELDFRLKLEVAEYCSACDEMICRYNGLQFVLKNRVKNGQID